MFPHCQLSPLSIWRTWTTAQWSTNGCGSLVKANTNFGLLSTLVFNDSVEENIHDVIWFPFENIVFENHNKAGQTVHIYVMMWAPFIVSLERFSTKSKRQIIFAANTSSYSHYVFSTLDLDDTGVITFEVRQLKKLNSVLKIFLFF